MFVTRSGTANAVTPMLAADQPLKRIASSPLGLSLIWLLIALSSVVEIQPAPYDGLVIVLGLCFFSLGLRIPARLGLPTLLLGLFLLANVIATFRIPNPTLNFAEPGRSILALPTRFHLIFSWIFFVSIIYEDPARVLKTIWKGYLVASVIAVGFGLLVHFGFLHVSGGWSESAQDAGRVKGTFEDPNVYGPFVVVAAVYLVAKMETSTKMEVLIRLALFGFLAVGILFSYSRGASANLVVSLGIFLSLRLISARTEPHQLKVILLAVTLILGATAGLTSLVMSHNVGDLFYERAHVFEKYDLEKGGRFDTQRRALEHIASDPIGIGPGQAANKLGLIPHNLYLTVPLETGWLGAFGLYGFILLTLWRSFGFCMRSTRLQHIYMVVFACTVGTALESFIIDTTHWRHMYLLWAMLWGPMLAWEAAHDRLALKLPLLQSRITHRAALGREFR